MLQNHAQQFQRLVSTAILTAGAIVLLTAEGVALAQVQFEDTTTQSGITYAGESYGASWGDLNGDGWPDLFVNHHRSTPSLLVNMGDQAFQDRWYEVDRWRAFPLLDQHGASWVDFDNDGDQDLFVSLGRKDANQFLVNNGKILTDLTTSYGLGDLRWEARLPVWFDFTQDGFLDWGMANRGAQVQLYSQNSAALPAQTFVRANAASGQKCEKNQYLQLADLNNDGTLDLLCENQELFPSKVYDFHSLPFTDITGILPPVPLVNDSVVADFDGNLQTDILLVRGAQRLTGAEITGPDSRGIQAYVSADGIKERGFNFVTGGDLSFALSWNGRNASAIHIGAEGYSLAPQPGGGPLVWNLSAADPANIGIQPHDPTVDAGIYIGYDPAAQRWTVLVSPASTRNATYWFVDSTSEISSLDVTGRQFGDFPVASTLYLNDNGAFTNQAVASGLGDPRSCVSAVAGDFDNDMDIDLYYVCRGAVSNLENQFYENQGDGTFVLMSNFGAEGPSGIGTGLGESVVTADYDLNGFLDLFVTNGLSMYPEDAYSVGGADKLFRNLGNANHWVLLDLVGTVANRDAAGAKVYVTAGGVTQLREQNGGYHRWSQNHQRVHVGLGANATMDIEVHWPSPSTQVDTFTDVPADRLYRVTEGGTLEEVTPPATVPPSPCEEPSFDRATEAGLFLWQNCNAGTWSLRASPGGQSLSIEGSILASQAFTSVTAVILEEDDLFDFTSDPTRITYSLKVAGNGTDGFDFTYPAAAGTCFRFDAPAGLPIYVGRLRVPVQAPFDLETMGVCGDMRPVISMADVTVNENDTSAVATLTLTLSAASTSPVSVDVVTLDGTAVAPADYTALPLTTIVFAPGETSRTLDIAIIDDPLAEGDETFTLALSNPVNATRSNTTATVTIVDDEPSPCDAPVYNRATEQAIFVWKDCTSGRWQTRMTAGGGTVSYRGKVVGDQNLLNVVGFSIETADTLDFTSDPTRISYLLANGGSAQDGFDFSLATGAGACFTVDAPASVPVFIGASRTPITLPFDLATLAACTITLPPTVAITDVTVAENAPDGQVAFTLSLSAASQSPVAVDIATVAGTATAPDDFTALPVTTLTFAPGETIQVVAVTIQNDALAEGNESFSVTLSNPVNALLVDTSATATIVDDEPSPCGTPVYDRTSEQGVFLWKDCTTGTWRARMTTGTGTLTYTGKVLADQNFISVAGFSIETADTLDAQSDPQQIAFRLTGGPGTQDGLDFGVPTGASTCFTLDLPASVPVYVGAARTQIAAPFDLSTLSRCGSLLPTTLSIGGATVAENSPDGEARFAITLSQPAATEITVDVISADGTASAPDDYTALPLTTVTFAAGETSQTVVIAIQDDTLPEGNETFTLALSNPVNAVLGTATATGTITDDEPSPCGVPVYDKSTEQGIFIWKDCGTGLWSARMTAGAGTMTYQGSVSADQAFLSVTGFNLEAADTLNVASVPSRIMYQMIGGPRSHDGIDFSFPASTNVCFKVDAPASIPVYLGAARTIMPAAFDLQTQEACEIMP